MKFESFFRPKSKEDVKKQTEEVSANLNTDIVHESMEKDLDILDTKDLKEKYQLRYNTYLAMLRAERQGNISEKIEEKDIHKAKVWINALNNLDNYITKQETGENKILRGRQVPVFNEIRNAIERGVTRGYVKLPTGVGKTVLFSQLIEALGLKSLIGVPSLPLVKQTSDKMEKFTTKSYGSYSSEGKDTTKDITTITYQSLIGAVRDGIIKSEDFPVFVLDEAHKALGPETSKAVRSMDDSLQIGFTATPNYSTEHSVSEVLPEEIYTMELREAIEEGLVNRTKTIHAFTNVDLSSVPVVKGDYDSKQLEKVINVHGRNMAALELYKNKFSDQKAIVNCSGVQHAKDVAKIFAEQGIKAAHIDGSMNEDQRNDILEKLATGELMVVTNARLLLEGFDEPTVSVALNLNPTLSLIDAEQRGGRVARLDDDNPEKWAYVIDFIDKNSKKKQVLFSEILGGDVVIPEAVDDKNNFVPMSPQERESRSRTPINIDDLEVDGLRVVVDSNEIMEVTKENQEHRESQEKKVWTYEALREDVFSKGVNSSKDYAKEAASNGWPSSITLRNMPEFPKNPDGSNDWDTFLGKEKFNFEKFRADVLSKNIKSSDDYAKKSYINKWPGPKTLRQMPEFPKNPDGTPSWSLFLGLNKEFKERINWSYEALRGDVLRNKIKSSQQYMDDAPYKNWPTTPVLTRMPEFPKNPDGSNDWDTFLGKEKFNFEKFRADVLSKNIKSSGEYGKYQKENKWPTLKTLINMPEFPKNPDGSNDWDTFLGKEKFNFEKFRADVLSKEVKTSKEYYEKRKDFFWPSAEALYSLPEFPKNPDGSNDWDTFLGREKSKKWTYESLRESVKQNNIKTSREYQSKQKENSWLASVTLTKLPEFPKNPDGSNDWDTFLGKK